jgi:hypothetical protein
LEICKELIAFLDGESLVQILRVVALLLKHSLASPSLLLSPAAHLPVLHEKIEFLTLHPMPAISSEASTVEQLILTVMREEGGADFGEYDN